MPYASDRQRRWFHTDSAKKAGIKPKTVEEFDEESKAMKLPKFSPAPKFPSLKSKLKGIK